MREALTSPLWAERDFEPATGPGSRLRRSTALTRPNLASLASIGVTSIPRCDECHRPLLRPSADGLGPICRARRAAEAGLRISPPTITRTPTALVDGQISLLDQLKEEQ